MQSSRVFTSGNSQAVRIPKEFTIDDSEVYIQKVGDSLILFPKKNPWRNFEESLSEFPDDFMVDGRNQPPIQEREAL
jgi:antitoxin VapB